MRRYWDRRQLPPIRVSRWTSFRWGKGDLKQRAGQGGLSVGTIRVTKDHVRAAEIEVKARKAAGLEPDPLIAKLADASVESSERIDPASNSRATAGPSSRP